MKKKKFFVYVLMEYGDILDVYLSQKSAMKDKLKASQYIVKREVQ